MKKRRARKKRSEKALRRLRKISLTIVGGILIAVLLFWGLFYVNSIEVVGNSSMTYTDEQIINMSLSEFWTKNSVLLRIFRSQLELEEIRFMENVEVEIRGRNSIRLHVNEKKPVGFVRLNDIDYYFDHDGLVLETMSSQETALLKQQALESSSLEATDSENPEQDTQDKVEGFNPSLADVPMITGLNVSVTEVGKRLPLNDPTFFNTIQFLTKMIDKYGIQPDYVEITENAKGVREMTLYYGAVRATLGTDNELEEKVTRLAAILPMLEGRSGILHLEGFASDTINIVFDEDQ